ncbi:agmatinase [Chromatiales bacterium (ex Bugula neritina AB1)]|nr:agmatinase [Chromatiales bacterium (ex Bugula neritina AB1)]
MTENIDLAINAAKTDPMGYEPTYSGILSLFRRVYSRDLSGSDIATWGIPYDLSVTNRPGARFGPRAIRSASTNLAWDGGPWPWGFDPFETLQMVDYGDCYFDHGYPQSIIDAIYQQAKSIIDQTPFLISMGGDHSVSYPLIKAHAEKHGPLALIQVDAHSDTWAEPDKRIDHGSMFYHAINEGLINAERSIQVGIRTMNSSTHGCTIFDANSVHINGVPATIDAIENVVGDSVAYLTFDIDGLDPAFAPGTGTPVCGGLSTWQAQTIIRGLENIDFVGMDLVEVAPAYDHAEITALAAASLLLDFICLRKKRLDKIA